MNFTTAITTDESSRKYLSDKVEWLLDLMDKEHKHASTHSQRNAYQAVIRIELEIMREELRHTYTAGIGIETVGAQIPF